MPGAIAGQDARPAGCQPPRRGNPYRSLGALVPASPGPLLCRHAEAGGRRQMDARAMWPKRWRRETAAAAARWRRRTGFIWCGWIIRRSINFDICPGSIGVAQEDLAHAGETVRRVGGEKARRSRSPAHCSKRCSCKNLRHRFGAWSRRCRPASTSGPATSAIVSFSAGKWVQPSTSARGLGMVASSGSR